MKTRMFSWFLRVQKYAKKRKGQNPGLEGWKDYLHRVI